MKPGGVFTRLVRGVIRRGGRHTGWGWTVAGRTGQIGCPRDDLFDVTRRCAFGCAKALPWKTRELRWYFFPFFFKFWISFNNLTVRFNLLWNKFEFEVSRNPNTLNFTKIFRQADCFFFKVCMENKGDVFGKVIGYNYFFSEEIFTAKNNILYNF